MATISVLVDNTPPGVHARVAPSPFSPNRDGRKDSTAIAVAVTEPVTMAVRVASRSGRTVRMPAQERSVEGRLRLRWEGRNDGGTRLRNGAYSVVVRVRDLAGNGASTRKRVVVDTAPPRLFWRAEAGVVGAPCPHRPFPHHRRVRTAQRAASP